MRYRPVSPKNRRLAPGGLAAEPPSRPEGQPAFEAPRLRSERPLLILYAAAILLASLLHDPAWLAGLLLVALALAGRDAARLLLRSLKAILVFNLAVGAGYAVLAWLTERDPWPTLLLINLRVLLLTFMTFLFMARANLFNALGFSRTLTYLLGLAYSQALAFRRAHDDFRLALVSRSPRQPTLTDRYRASAAAASWFMEKGFHSARDTAQALRSRGFFDA